MPFVTEEIWGALRESPVSSATDEEPMLVRAAWPAVGARAGDAELTEPGTSVGTPLYMAPEQLAAGVELDERADVYGLAATLYAQLAMGESWRVGVDESERTDLVTAGPFAVVRNPIFAAMIPTSLGLTLMVPNVVAFIGFAALVLALEIQVRLVEEPYLRAAHGQAYTSYAARTGRFAPGVGRMGHP